MKYEPRARSEVDKLNRMTLGQAIQKHPVRSISVISGILIFALSIMYALMFMVTGAGKLLSLLIFLAGGIFMLGVAAVVGSMVFFSPKGKLAQDQAARLVGADLNSMSIEQLNQLIDFQLQQGNIQEADRVSQHLLEVTERIGGE
jgi:hypothetical protein